jgi:hypothetical protein
VQHHTIQINHQPDARVFQFIFLTFIYSSTCFRRSPAHHQELITAVAASAFTFVSWWQSCCVRGRASRPAGPTTKTARLSPRYKGKSRDCYCSYELLMMGGRTPETCWAVNKRQDNKLENSCIWLVIYLNWVLCMYIPNVTGYILYIITNYVSPQNLPNTLGTCR